MINISSPDKKFHSGIIGYSIDNLGNLIVRSLNPMIVPDKYQLIVGQDYNQDVVIKTSFKSKEYQALVASFVIDNVKSLSSINITYVNPPKALGKPNKFDVDSKKLWHSQTSGAS